MPIIAYRAKQSTDTAGTGTLVLSAAASNARSFQAAFGAAARRIQYCIQWSTGFEIGYGDFDGGSPGSLTRATILASSNSGGLVALPAGTKDVFSVVDPAAREVIAIAGTANLALADLGNTVVFSGGAAATLNLPAVAAVASGAGWLVLNVGSAALTIDPNASETINGQASIALMPGMTAHILRSGAGWVAGIFGHGRLIGEYVQVAGPNLPPFCVWPNGQNLSRSSYATLFAAIGTTYGAGDGAISFGTPDVRGRALFGLDNLGGVAASRITSGVSGINAAALGNAGGDQRIGTHGHVATQAAHNHAGSTDSRGGYGSIYGLRYTDHRGANGIFSFATGPNSWDANNGQSNTWSASLDTTHAHNVSIGNATPPVTVSDFAGGASANMPPMLICTVALFAGA
ncbi:MAG: tail fiber protein [Roseomonas sp.]|nr:tail fiber protein [Roseomonas sp.]MCA3333011.1 tail fiber protein [Roseomonas sp.]MCA3355580.1 tail fiber protein [Roseomonas sp.]MCA3385511.1 tail fiber protein [Roseomonas sp.]MCA3395210.1 tail fiber protein [Roseomonas sp.]